MRLVKFKQDMMLTVIVELLAKIPLYAFEFLLASWLVLNDYAEWTALGLIYRTAPYAHLGALSYFNKRYPVALGAGKKVAAEKIQRHTNRIFNGLVLFFFGFSLLLFLFKVINTLTFIAICGVLSIQIYSYCQALVRNEGAFFAYGMGLILFSIFQLFIAYFTVRRYGVLAGAFSTFLAYSMAVFYYLFILKMKYEFYLPKRKNFNRVFKMGWPPFLLTISSFLVQISDRVALVCVDDDSKLAFYGFFSLFFQIGIIAINAIGKVLSPYIFHLSGKSKLSDTLSISTNTCLIILGLYFCMNIAMLIGGGSFIDTYFPKFTGGLIGVYNYASMGILMSLTLTFYPQLIVAGREQVIVKINFSYFILSFSMIYFLAKFFTGFWIYSLGSFLINMFYSGFIFSVIEKVVQKKIKMARFIICFIGMATLIVNYVYFMMSL